MPQTPTKWPLWCRPCHAPWSIQTGSMTQCFHCYTGCRCSSTTSEMAGGTWKPIGRNRRHWSSTRAAECFHGESLDENMQDTIRAMIKGSIKYESIYWHSLYKCFVEAGLWLAPLGMEVQQSWSKYLRYLLWSCYRYQVDTILIHVFTTVPQDSDPWYQC